jgi:hypothetical protein
MALFKWHGHTVSRQLNSRHLTIAHGVAIKLRKGSIMPARNIFDTYNAIKRKRPLEAMFWDHVKKRMPDKCWFWTGERKYDGRGQKSSNKSMYGVLAMRIGGKTRRTVKLPAHRVSYALHYGEPDLKLLVMHTCNTPLCVNPWHLELGTNKDNAAYMAQCGRSLKGDKNAKAKLTEKAVKEIKELCNQGKTLKSIAELFGVHLATIGYIRQGKIWKHVKTAKEEEQKP